MNAKLLTQASRAVGFPQKSSGNLKKMLVAGGLAGAAAGGAYAHGKNKDVEKKASALAVLGQKGLTTAKAAGGALAIPGKKSKLSLLGLTAGAGAVGAAAYGYNKSKDNVEKKAAFNALSNAGYDFDTAVAMVKAASASEVFKKR